jgi:hypothetical protein
MKRINAENGGRRLRHCRVLHDGRAQAYGMPIRQTSLMEMIR